MRPALSIFSSKRFRQAVSILVLLAMLAGGLVFLSRALRVNDGYYKNRPFLADQRDYDVLFFGTSHIINSVLPMQLWKEYGITSYNLGIHGGSVACSYWMMRNAVEQHKPKIAVMETFLTHAQYTSMEIALAHAAFDPFPMNKTKVQGILDLYSKNSDRYELFFPLDVFHNRWKYLNTEKLYRGMGQEAPDSRQKGGELRLAVTPNTNPILVPADQYPEESDTVALQYLRKFITYCQEEDIIPVVISIPFHDGHSEDYQRYSNLAMDMAREMGAATLDLQYTDLIDEDTDWYDNASHLNPLGAKKVTRAVGDYLTENYALETHSDDPDWAQDYAQYTAWLEETMTSTEDIWEILSLLGVEEFTAKAEIPETFQMNPLAEKVLTNIGDRVETVTVPTGNNWQLTVYGPEGQILNQKTFWI